MVNCVPTSASVFAKATLRQDSATCSSVNKSKVSAPPAEREASGSPLKGGGYVGKAPLGLNDYMVFALCLAEFYVE